MFRPVWESSPRALSPALRSSSTAFLSSSWRSLSFATRIATAPYAGWRLHEARLTLAEGSIPLACNPLLGSQSTPAGGTSAEVLDLGRGTLDEFAARAEEIPGRFVLVRHEYPFSAEHVHRRRKYGWAMERGAAGFLQR